MIETTGDFKKQVKALVKGAIKSKVFGGENGNYEFKVVLGDFDKKEHLGTVTVSIENGPMKMELFTDVSTRVYNKVNDEFFAPIATQYGKLKGVQGLTFSL